MNGRIFSPKHLSHLIKSQLITSEKLLLVIETVSLNGGEFTFVLLDYFLELNVQLLLLLLKKLLLLKAEQTMLEKKHLTPAEFLCTITNTAGVQAEIACKAAITGSAE